MPYEVPTRHHALDADGQPLDQPPAEGRRRSELITPVPKPRKQKRRGRKHFAFENEEDLKSDGQEYNPSLIVIGIHKQSDLREKFLEVCRAQNKLAALREFMREYAATQGADNNPDKNPEGRWRKFTYNNARTHLFLGKDAPARREISS